MARITPVEIRKRKEEGRRLTMLTAYDYSTAVMIDGAGIDMVLVGDSLGMVVLGYDSTVPVTMEEMLHHSAAVSRGVSTAMVIGDMPFMSYQVSDREAVSNAGRFLKEAGCDGVKLEGGMEMAGRIAAITRAGIPVMGHIGLTPQTATALGGFRVQGRDLESARRLLMDAKAVEEAGAFAVVLECVPTPVAKVITQELSIPTIGIGAGPHCDGQVLVTHDLLGLFKRFTPRFVKQYLHLAPEIEAALARFKEEVESGAFPDEEHSFGGDPALEEELRSSLKG